MKVLFLAGRKFSDKPQSGGEQVSLRNYKLLQRIFGRENIYLCMFSNSTYEIDGDNVKVIPTYHNKLELLVDTFFLRNVCNRSNWKDVITYVQQMNPDLIFVDSSHIGKLVEACKTNALIVIFFHNIEVNYTWNKFKKESVFYWIAYKSWGKNEKNSVRIADRIILLNSRDNNELSKIYGRNADYILPVTFKDVFCENQVDTSKHYQKQLLFVGSLFQANYTGILWFIKKVMPFLNSSEYILKIVGKNFEQRKKELEIYRNIKVIGTVDSLEKYYNSADAVILPILYGDGMKVKTAEAMMYGKRILATSEALEGYDVSGLSAIHRCDNEEMFLNCITQFVTNHYEGRFHRDVRERFLLKYETQTVEDDFEKMLGTAMGK